MSTHLLNKKQQRRNELFDNMKTIWTACERENRRRTSRETTDCEQMETEIQSLEKDIRELGGHLARESQMNYTPNSPFKPDPNGASRRHLPKVEYATALQAAVRNNGMFSGAALEASQEIERQTGLAGQGTLFSFDSLALKGRSRFSNALTAGTDSEGGYFVPIEVVEMIDVIRKKSVLAQAGATILSGLKGDLGIPRKTTNRTGTWAAEGATVSTSELAFDQVLMSPNRCVVVTEATKQFIMQSSSDVHNMIHNDAIGAISATVEAAAINGSGSGAEPLGIIGTSGIGSVVGGTNGAGASRDDIVDLESAVSLDNADIGNLAYVTNTKVRGTLKKTLVDSGSGIFAWPVGSNEMNGYNAFASNHVPSDLDKGTSTGVCSAILFGNWADLVIGYFGVMDVVIDPYTLATSGKVRAVITVYVDIAVRHPESFSAMLDALTA